MPWPNLVWRGLARRSLTRRGLGRLWFGRRLGLVRFVGCVVSFGESALLLQQPRTFASPSLALSGRVVLSALMSYQATNSPAVCATNLFSGADWPAKLMAEIASGICPRRPST